MSSNADSSSLFLLFILFVFDVIKALGNLIIPSAAGRLRLLPQSLMIHHHPSFASFFSLLFAFFFVVIRLPCPYFRVPIHFLIFTLCRCSAILFSNMLHFLFFPCPGIYTPGLVFLFPPCFPSFLFLFLFFGVI